MRLLSALLSACSFSAQLASHDAGSDVIVPDGSVCSAMIDQCVTPDILRSCSGEGATYIDMPCAWGCIAEMGRCGEVAPAAGAVMRSDTVGFDGLDELMLASGTVIDGSTGAIGTDAAPEARRAAGTGTIAGIAYAARGTNTGMFRVRKLTISGDVLLVGSKSIAFVADEEIAIAGVIDARGRCRNLGQDIGGEAGPGGIQGGAKKVSAANPGGGTGGGTTNTNGGGGGGHGGTGGRGGGTLMAAGGAPFDPAFASLVGGGGGGGGGGGNGNTQPGGGGGGALQLVSNKRIEITSAGGINAGGCGGFSTTGPDSGGGGGAGGTIILEAPRVIVDGKLAVNGGGGGAGEGALAPKGEDGKLSRMPALGAVGQGTGGAGGVAAALDGGPGTLGSRSGGGGGAVGRMLIRTKRDAGITIGGNAELSPSFSDPATTCARGSANVQ